MDYDYSKKLRTRGSKDDTKIRCDCGGICYKKGKDRYKLSIKQRYRCIICKQYKWLNLDPNHEKAILKQRG